MFRPSKTKQYILPTDHKPVDIEVITDLLLEDYKNFPQVRELREDSARFIREEMERTWGQSHLAVLSEDESQSWLLGVIFTLLAIAQSELSFRCCYENA